jgi:hypothetical protein
MDILERLTLLEKEVALLKASKSDHHFHEVMHTIQVTDEDLQLVYQSSMMPHILRILLETNKRTPFLKVKRKLCKYENEWIPMSDYDIENMVKHLERLFIQLHSRYAESYSPEDFFEKVKPIYGLKINVKKIKSDLMNAL